MRRHHPARPAPRRPEIDQQRQVRARGVQFEVARVEHDRLRGEQRLAAAAAVRPVAEAFAGYAIERAAVRAGEIERHVHAPAASRLSSPSRTRPSPSPTVTATSMPWPPARKSGVWGKSVSVRVDRGGRRTIKKKKK